jgi:hypothetical protein
MARSFPQIFDLRLFPGPRAKQFARSEDAFQQLLGDALKRMAGPYAHVSPTRGRDGSIDAFLLEAAPLEGPFENLPLPLIVECKTHDDTLKEIERNILGQWAAVKKKLEANASAGWKGLFEPWLQARSYVYCVSAHIHAAQVRSSLTNAIQEFFGALPTDQRPPIHSIRVVDWSDLRFWLNSLPSVCDEWLGIELELILDHATFLNRLSGFREYLLPSKLEFVQPTLDVSFHPTRVLQEIEAADKNRGVLLVGAGGVGKTRTAMEVGSQAANAGWRVLHILPDEPGIETENLAEIVLPYSNSRTLLIFDYIDQMQRLDFGSLRRSLIPSANERGIQLRLLANARPGWMTLHNPERDELFRVIEIRPTDEHKSAVIETMARRVAPLASEMIGRVEVMRLCGTRAIIALLIARELETRATENLLKDLNTTTFRSGDLVQWLQRRLQENALLVKHDVVALVAARPDTPMVAAAAALACAPDTHETLILAAQSAFANLQWPTALDDARILVQSLLKFGWLEAHGLFDSTAHDVVADEVLEQAIHSDAIVFERELAAILACALTIPRGIGRLATALRRVINSLKSEEISGSLTASLERWFEANALTIGKVLETGEPDITGYALGAILSGPPWDRTAIKNWNVLVLPWLNAHSTKKEARHLLYKSLRTIEAYDETLVASALVWLERHGQTFDARFVFGALLQLRAFQGDDAKAAIESALRWFELYRDRVDAQFVLRPLLERNDLEGYEASKIRATALRWVERYRDTINAPFVLRPLLERSDLESSEPTKIRAMAVCWLELYRDTVDAQFVLRPLLERSDLEGDEANKIRATALRWLERYRDRINAQFVIGPLLERSDLEGSEATKIRATALHWLQLYGDTIDAGFVLPPLLECRDLEANEANQVRATALRWLERHCDTIDAQFVLHQLLKRRDLESYEADKAREFAVRWLDQYHETLEAGFVLPQLLRQRELRGDNAAPIVEKAVKWLEIFYDTTDAEFVLKRLFRRDDVPPDARIPLLTSAIQRLRKRLREGEATFLLQSCLQYRIEDIAVQKELVGLAMKWFELHPENPDGDYVWNRILHYRPDRVSDSDWLAVSRHALLWLKRKRISDIGFDRTVNSLLMRPHLLEPLDRSYVIGLGVELLGTHLHEQGRRRLVASLLWQVRFLSEEDPLKRQITEAIRTD